MSHSPRTTWLVLIGALTLPLAAGAQDVAGAGSYPFLGSARTVGMAGAFTAIADDTAGLNWNPAGMAQADQRQVEASLNVNGGNDYIHAGLIMPLKSSKFGGGVSFINAKDSAGRKDMAIQYTYGQWFLDEVAFGASVRWHNVDAGSESDSNFSFDFGALYRPKKYKAFTLGIAALDINEPSFKGIGYCKRLFNVGVAYRPDKYTVVDVEWYDVGSIAKMGQIRAGVERQVTQNIAVRAGVAEQTFGVGLSLMYKYLTIDYGYQRIKNAPDYNVISLVANF